MIGRKTLLLTICIGIALVHGWSEDPLCILEDCPSNMTCRVVTECPSPNSCNLSALCMETPPRWSHTGVCQIGQPILVMRDGAWDDSRCGSVTLPCPYSTICNIDLADTYSTCCRSNPTINTKPGQCPPDEGSDNIFCGDTCLHDGDCRHNSKCCKMGCARHCFNPVNVTNDICEVKNCGKGKTCLTSEMPACLSTGVCYNAGDCVSCRKLCKTACSNGLKTDIVGCPLCKCNSKVHCKQHCQQACFSGSKSDLPGCPFCKCKSKKLCRQVCKKSCKSGSKMYIPWCPQCKCKPNDSGKQRLSIQPPRNYGPAIIESFEVKGHGLHRVTQHATCKRQVRAVQSLLSWIWSCLEPRPMYHKCSFPH